MTSGSSGYREGPPKAWKTLRLEMWERAGGCCEMCKEPVPFDRTMHLDHIIPAIMGGRTTEENLRVTHATCNLRRSHPRWHGFKGSEALRIAVEGYLEKSP